MQAVTAGCISFFCKHNLVFFVWMTGKDNHPLKISQKKEDYYNTISYFVAINKEIKTIMAQGSRQVQTQAQQQIQTLSPQQILVVKLLELPTVELEERIHSEILDNPALEEGKEMPDNEDDNTEYAENEERKYGVERGFFIRRLQ